MSDREAITITPRIDPRPKGAAAPVEARRRRESGRVRRSPLARRIAGLATRRRALSFARGAATRLRIPGAKFLGPGLPVVLGAAAAAAVAKVITGKETAQMAIAVNEFLLGGADDQARAEKAVRDRLFARPGAQVYATVPGGRSQLSAIFKTQVEIENKIAQNRRSLENQDRFQTKNEFDLLVDRLVDAFKTAWASKQAEEKAKQTGEALGAR